MAAFEGYQSHPLCHRAEHAAQRLLAPAEVLAWREGACVTHAMASLFQTDTAFGFVHALYLSKLLAAVGHPPAVPAVS